MSDDDGITRDDTSFVLTAKHRILLLIGLTIIITSVFTAIGLMLYNTSGSAQLDLSRPGYKGVNEIVEKNKPTFVEYPATGEINEATLKEFQDLYKKHLDNVKSVEAFRGDPLAPDALGIDEATAE